MLGEDPIRRVGDVGFEELRGGGVGGILQPVGRVEEEGLLDDADIFGSDFLNVKI
ncbi:MAG: hypothetical protein ACJAQT_001416 [Akkermansiaceae bacterium]